jgi:hypothetical protein
MSDCLDKNLRNFSDETLNQPRSALKKNGGTTFQPVQHEAHFPGHVMAGQTHPTLPPAMLRLMLLPPSWCPLVMTVGI